MDFKGIVEHFANSSYDTIFNNYINGIADYESLLREAMDYIGCELSLVPSLKYHERSLGFKVIDALGTIKVSSIYPNSASDVAGLTLNDEILAINHIQLKADGAGNAFAEWCNYFSGEQVVFTVSTNGIIKQLTIIPDSKNTYYKIAKIQKKQNVDEQQKMNFEAWSLTKF
ncbi:MAG: hypothetical protein IPH89_11525 [Bacteroidetes bacterium]|nr:hypothetical protein [Bacteroidota bacterium]